MQVIFEAIGVTMVAWKETAYIGKGRDRELNLRKHL